VQGYLHASSVFMNRCACPRGL